MLKKTISYTDFNDNERTEDFFFNLTKAELVEFDICYNGGLQAAIEKITASKDNAVIVELFKDVIRRSYGEQSTDGKRFMKSKEITDSFCATEAYSVLFMEFMEDPSSAAAFINGVIPATEKSNPINGAIKAATK